MLSFTINEPVILPTFFDMAFTFYFLSTLKISEYCSEDRPPKTQTTSVVVWLRNVSSQFYDFPIYSEYSETFEHI